MEVLSVHCKNEDATYLKYALAEASSQGLLDKGLFVPTGIHLMESKEVMLQLRKEHQEFLAKVTSIHMGGISYDEMKSPGTFKENLQIFVLQCKGVLAVEPTYQTDTKGSWTLVVERKEITRITNFISSNIDQIYRNRRGQTSKVVNHQTQRATGYRLVLVYKWAGRVGTYAEVLKNRFPRSNQQTDPLSLKRQVYESQYQDKVVDKNESGAETKSLEGDFRERTATNSGEYENGSERIKYHKLHRNKAVGTGINTSKMIGMTVPARKEGDNKGKSSLVEDTNETTSEQQHRNVYERISLMEKGLLQKLQDIKTEHNANFATFETRMKKNVEGTIESKLKVVSNALADTVTNRMKKMMLDIMQGTRTLEEPGGIREESVFSQYSPSVTDRVGATKADRQSETDNTKQMLNELLRIEQANCNLNDPLHDNKPIGPSRAVK